MAFYTVDQTLGRWDFTAFLPASHHFLLLLPRSQHALCSFLLPEAAADRRVVIMFDLLFLKRLHVSWIEDL